MFVVPKCPATVGSPHAEQAAIDLGRLGLRHWKMFCPIIDREASPDERRSPGISRVVSTCMETWARRRRDARRRIEDADFDRGVRTKSVRAGRPTRPSKGNGPFAEVTKIGPVRTLSFIGKQTRGEFDPERAIRLSQVRSGHSRPDSLGAVRTLRSGHFSAGTGPDWTGSRPGPHVSP